MEVHAVSWDWIADPSTDKRLLPNGFRRFDNSRRREYCKRAVNKAIEVKLTPRQKRRIDLHFRHGLSMTEIAQMENTNCSSISKSLRAAQDAIREYANDYMEIYDELEKELAQDYEN